MKKPMREAMKKLTDYWRRSFPRLKIRRGAPKMINAYQDDHVRLSTNRKKTQEMAEGAQDDQGDQGTPVGKRRLQTGSAFVQEQND